jgi:ATP-dependent Lon protease
LPGKLIQALRQTKSRYPVVLLDEIDKLGQDRGQDLSAAMLEVLDPEQNKEFVDHYLAVPFDTSQVLYIGTANDIERIPGPLLDRMEPIELVSYTDVEKLVIAKRHIIPAVRAEMRLTQSQFTLSDSVIMAMMRRYTREAGVRQLARELKNLGRKVVRRILERRHKSARLSLKVDQLGDWLGPPRYQDEPTDALLDPGVAIGLAYTEVGGEVLFVETNAMDAAQSSLRLTGNLGKVMQESAQAALSLLRARGAEFGLANIERLHKAEVHVHFPDGGTPKDGPSAGIAILCAMASAIAKKSLPQRLAMTGEITLRGQVIPVGGIREKVLAAYRFQKTRILYPAMNESDLADVPAEVRQKLELIPVATAQDVLREAGLIEL